MLDVPGLTIIGPRLPRNWREGDHLDRLCIVLVTVLEGQIHRSDTDGFSPISERRLAELVGRDFASRALHFLCEATVGVLECDGFYTPGTKCRGYRFRDDILAHELSPYWIPPKLASSISAFDAKHSRIGVGDKPCHQTLWRNLCGLTLGPFPTDLLPPRSSDPKIQLKHHAWQQAVARIKNQRWHFATDRRTGRIFNNFTSLSKLLRPYALLDGKTCAEIDIRNSQPFFMTTLYPSRSNEAVRFAKVVSEGRFYESLNAASGNPFADCDRLKLKEAIFTEILFGRRWATSRLWQGFLDLFPEMARIVATLKSRDYRSLAVELQRREARLMIQTVVPRLSSSLPGVPFLTVHDSLAIDARHADQAAALIIECAQEQTGNTPSLRITPPATRSGSPHTHSAQSSSACASTVFTASSCKSGG